MHKKTINFIGNDGAYGQVLLYDIRTGTYKTYDNVTSVIWGYGDIQVLELKNNEYIIISGDGKVERKFNYDDYIFACYEGCRLSEYIYEKNIIIYKNNKKYGIQKIDNGEIILDAIYDSMRFVDNKYYIAEINGKYNLYNINNNKKATKKGYDQLFFLNEDLILTYKDQEISFINSKEEKLSDDTIPAENLYPILPKNPLGINAYIDENNICKISVCVGTDFDDAQCFDYTFNLNTHELIKLDGITY